MSVIARRGSGAAVGLGMPVVYRLGGECWGRIQERCLVRGGEGAGVLFEGEMSENG